MIPDPQPQIRLGRDSRACLLNRTGSLSLHRARLHCALLCFIVPPTYVIESSKHILMCSSRVKNSRVERRRGTLSHRVALRLDATLRSVPLRSPSAAAPPALSQSGTRAPLRRIARLSLLVLLPLPREATRVEFRAEEKSSARLRLEMEMESGVE